jgi:beta-galactosidase
VLATPARAQRPAHDFHLGDSTFLLDGRPLQIISGELHFARIPREYWRHRLRMARAMGLNTIATYVFWNYHEPRPGEFDFHSGNHDLAAFVRTAQEEGLWVILRPGPYACAEWDLGGLPAWLLKPRDLEVRSNDPRFLDAARRYVRALYQQVESLQVTRGGPILMVQVENEYGSFGADSAYREALRRMFVDAGFEVPLFTADGDWLFDRGAISGLLPAANGEENYDTLVARVNRFHGGRGPYFVAEFYPGWLAHWAEPHPDVPAERFLPALERLLRRGASVNLYMFHGGTNFAFWAGANYTREVPIQPDLTSYDYDAPLSEAGWPSPKFYAIRDLLVRLTGTPPPAVPESLPVITIPPVTLRPVAALPDLLARADTVAAARPMTFEELDQPFGYVLYRHTFAEATSGELAVEGLHDWGLVLVNGQRVAVLERRSRTLRTPVHVPRGGRLDILVETQGRINFGRDMVGERKGIVGAVRLDGVALVGWTMFRLPFDAAPAATGARFTAPGPDAPALWRGSFDLDRVGDTFLDLRGWGKGIVFVNGVNLGRYWNVGPQRTLYLPGAWLRSGRNEIVLFEQLAAPARPAVAGLARPILRELDN